MSIVYVILQVQPSTEEMIHFTEEKTDLPEATKQRKPKKGKRAAEEYTPIRLHTVFHSSTSDKSFFTSSNGAFQKAVSFFSKSLLVNPRRTKLTLQPRCSKTITSGVNTGKCKKVDKNVQSCGPFTVPKNLQGAGVECKKKAGSCKSKGSAGTGVDADFILFAGAIDSQ